MKKVLLVLIVMFGLMILSFCEAKIDPENEWYLPGEWEVTIIYNNSLETITEHYYFEGSQNRGTFRTDSNKTGTYTANNQLIFFMFDDKDWKFNGEFYGFSDIKGIFILLENGEEIKGSFSAHRIKFYLKNI